MFTVIVVLIVATNVLRLFGPELHSKCTKTNTEVSKGLFANFVDANSSVMPTNQNMSDVTWGSNATSAKVVIKVITSIIQELSINLSLNYI